MQVLKYCLSLLGGICHILSSAPSLTGGFACFLGANRSHSLAVSWPDVWDNLCYPNSKSIATSVETIPVYQCPLVAWITLLAQLGFFSLTCAEEQVLTHVCSHVMLSCLYLLVIPPIHVHLYLIWHRRLHMV